MAVAITRTDLSARDLGVAATKTAHAKAARRMLAIALVIDGVARRTAAESCGMDRQTLRGEEDEETVRDEMRSQKRRFCSIERAKPCFPEERTQMQ